MRDQPVLEFDKLCVDLGGRRILDGLSGHFSGKSIGLLGPNGAGKSTLIRTLLGFHHPSQGSARILGLSIPQDFAGIRARVGYMPEDEAFIPHLTAVQFVTLMGEISGLPPETALERAHQALFYVGLGEVRYRAMKSYSLGMKQLAKLAQALVHGPVFLILDEPTNGLDPPARRRMIELIQEIRDQPNVHLLISSHLLPDVAAVCDTVLILKGGRLAAHCDLAAERQSPHRLLEVETSGNGEGFLRALQELGCRIGFGQGRRLKILLPPGVEIRRLYAAAAQTEVQIRRLEHKSDSLEDVFLRAMEEHVGSL